MVSRSGFYGYEYRLKNKDINPREIQDRKDFDLILEIYNRRGFKIGSRTIYMILKKENKLMNLKKIQRLMRKYGLICPIRKPNPYKK